MDRKKLAVMILPDGRMDRANAARYLGLSTKHVRGTRHWPKVY